MSYRAERLKILVATSVFPNSKQPTLGIFVKERMFNAAKHCELKVIAPVPWFPFIRYLKKDYRPRVPYLEIQDGIEIYHPRFFSVPRFFKCLDGFFFFISSITTALNLNKNFKFDIIDSHFVYPDGFGAVLLGKFFRRPVTITIRGTIKKLLKYPLVAIQIKYALKKTIRVFAVCNELKEVVTGLGIPEEKTVVIPNGVDVGKFRHVEKLRARSELGIPADKKIIVSVGGLVERKGFHRVLSVLPQVKQAIPDIMYVMVGGASVEGNYEPVLMRMVKELSLRDYVMFAGQQLHDNLYKWFSASDIFCLATSNEGWANVFLEAMACGLPVVTTRVGGNEEVVSSDDYGMLFELEDKDGMAYAIIKSVQKEWNREKIINYARKNTWDIRINHLISQFNSVINSYNNRLPEKALIQ